MNSKILFKKLGKYYPKKIYKKYGDFAGLQVGKIKEEINTIFLCLDFDDIVFDYLVKNNLLNKIDIIITHHPFIYGKKKDVLKRDEIKRNLYQKVLDNNLTIYSFHTNFDEGKEGMNDALASALNLKNIKTLSSMPMARGGNLEKSMDVYEFAKYAKEKLDVNYGLLLPYGKKEINKVAIIGGGGWHYFLDAKNEGYDIFISGDMPHHGRRDLILNKYNYLDLPHEIEKIFTKQFKKVLLDIDKDLTIYSIDHEELPIVI